MPRRPAGDNYPAVLVINKTILFSPWVKKKNISHKVHIDIMNDWQIHVPADPPPIFLTKILDRICTDLRNNPGGCQIRGKSRIRGTLTCLIYVTLKTARVIGSNEQKYTTVEWILFKIWMLFCGSFLFRHSLLFIPWSSCV